MSEWQDGGRAARTEQFRQALALAGSGQAEEAIRSLRELLDQPELGRRLRCKVHTALSRLLSGQLGSALQHAEEALRLADLISDPFLRGDALVQVVDLSLAHGDLSRGRQAVHLLQQLLVRQPGALGSGSAHAFWLLGRVLRSSGDWSLSLAALAQAEAMVQAAPEGNLIWEIRAERAALLLETGRLTEARNLLVLITQVTARDPLPRALELQAAEVVLTSSADADRQLARALAAAGGRYAVRARILAWWARHCPLEQNYALRALSEAALSGRWDVLADVHAIMRMPQPC